MQIENLGNQGEIIEFPEIISNFSSKEKSIESFTNQINKALNPKDKLTRVPLMIAPKTSLVQIPKWREQIIIQLQKKLGVNIGIFNEKNLEEKDKPQEGTPIIKWNAGQISSLSWPTNMENVFFVYKIKGLMGQPTLYLRREKSHLQSNQI